jgi:phosphatidylserine/phosphatidylglycerophosphate/cardiolipin synthase-like enzyme
MRHLTNAYSHVFHLALAGCLLLAACGPLFPTAPPAQVISTSRPDAVAGWLQVYFTDPASPQARDYTGGPDQVLAAAIDRARLSVDVAAYSLNLWSIRDALIRAHRRGVAVRLVMESDNMDAAEVQDLIDGGIPVIGDRREGLMHDKFVVIDRAEVWTGSMNLTVGGAYRDNNNLICIRSTPLATDYTARFEDMFLRDRFGPEAVADTPHPRLEIDGTPVEVYFSPADGVAQHILDLLAATRTSINFMAYTFTSNPLGEAIRERALAGVAVSGVMDDGQINSAQGTEYDPFLQAGLDVRRGRTAGGLMHHKVIILDEKIVITGSYNFTASAETSNDENLLVIFNPDVAARYLQEFQRVYAQAQP